MPEHTAARALQLAMRSIGVILIAAFWPLTWLWPSGWAWHADGPSVYLTMMIGIYATLGAFLIWASRDPVRHLGLVWFTIWSSVVHAGIMTVQAIDGGHATMGHLLGDIPALLLVAAVLGVLARRTPEHTAAAGLPGSRQENAPSPCPGPGSASGAAARAARSRRPAPRRALWRRRAGPGASAPAGCTGWCARPA